MKMGECLSESWVDDYGISTSQPNKARSERHVDAKPDDALRAQEPKVLAVAVKHQL